MFCKSFFAFAAATLPAVVSTIVITTPGSWEGNSTNTVTWTSDSTDPPLFSVELVNNQFHDTFALANNVQTALGSVAIPLPELAAGPEFTLEFINISNIAIVYATSANFPIKENDFSGDSTVSSGTATGASTVSGSLGATPSTVSPVSPTPTTPVSTSSSTGGPVTVEPSSTPSSSSSSTSGSSGSSSAPSAAATTGAATSNVAVSSTIFVFVAGLIGVYGL